MHASRAEGFWWTGATEVIESARVGEALGASLNFLAILAPKFRSELSGLKSMDDAIRLVRRQKLDITNELQD